MPTTLPNAQFSQKTFLGKQISGFLVEYNFVKSLWQNCLSIAAIIESFRSGWLLWCNLLDRLLNCGGRTLPGCRVVEISTCKLQDL